MCCIGSPGNFYQNIRRGSACIFRRKGTPKVRIKIDGLFSLLMRADRKWAADSIHRAGLWIKSATANRECAAYRFVFRRVEYAGARTTQDSAGFFFFKHIILRDFCFSERE